MATNINKPFTNGRAHTASKLFDCYASNLKAETCSQIAFLCVIKRKPLCCGFVFNMYEDAFCFVFYPLLKAAGVTECLSGSDPIKGPQGDHCR